jgi:hypothetical protein
LAYLYGLVLSRSKDEARTSRAHFWLTLPWKVIAFWVAITVHPPYTWLGWTAAAGQIWVWSKAVMTLFNKRRRALHDFIASTVVTAEQKVSDAQTQVVRGIKESMLNRVVTERIVLSAWNIARTRRSLCRRRAGCTWDHSRVGVV